MYVRHHASFDRNVHIHTIIKVPCGTTSAETASLPTAHEHIQKPLSHFVQALLRGSPFDYRGGKGIRTPMSAEETSNSFFQTEKKTNSIESRSGHITSLEMSARELGAFTSARVRLGFQKCYEIRWRVLGYASMTNPHG